MGRKNPTLIGRVSAFGSYLLPSPSLGLVWGGICTPCLSHDPLRYLCGLGINAVVDILLRIIGLGESVKLNL